LINEKTDGASEKKLALVFKYDRSGILSISWAEAILTENSKENTYQMEIVSEFHGPKSMTRSQKQAAWKLKETFESIDKKVEAKRKARNDLETLVFSSKEWLDDEKNLPYLQGDSEKQSILKEIAKHEDWLENEGYDSTLEIYKQKKSDLEKHVKPVKKRKQSWTTLKKELKNLLTKINEIENKYDQYIAKKDWLPEDEKSKVNSYLAECSEWHKTQSDIIDETALNQNLLLTKEEILVRIANIDDRFKNLKAVKKPKAPKKIDEDEELEIEEEKPKPKKKKEKQAGEKIQLDPAFMDQVDKMKRG